ncbi:MAG TPA: hypothetical protein VM639_24690 [Dongiaceae bacterium]|nr:hypothetical protein [Dongiaceae bacterium]
MAEDFSRIVDLGAELQRDLAQLLPQEVKELHITYAKEVKASEMSASGFRPAEVQTIVDGRTPAAEEQVQPFGIIAYRFGSIVDVAFEVRDLLIEKSPKGETGLYASSWFAIVNGEPVAWEALEQTWKPGQEIWISNDQPYSRILEMGADPNGPLRVFKVPAHTTQKILPEARSRFGNLVRINDTFIDLHGPGTGKAKPSPTHGSSVPWILQNSQGRKGRLAGDPINYPAVVITPL